jgi:MFS family permease
MRANRSIIFFLASDLITQFGAGMMLTSSNWYVLSMTGSNTMVALVAAANTVSGFVSSLFGGMLVDLFGPKCVTVASHCIRILFVVVSAMLFARFEFRMGFALLLVLNNGIGWNLYYPASKSLIQRLTVNTNATRINSVAEVSMQIGLFASGAAAGLLYKRAGFLVILIVSVIMFLIGIMALLAVHVPPDVRIKQKSSQNVDQDAAGLQASKAPGTTLLRSSQYGIAYLLSHPAIVVWCTVLYMPFVVGNVNQTLLAGYVRDGLNAGSVEFGVVQSLWGVGACLAGLLSSVATRAFHPRSMVYAGIVTLTGFGLVLWLASNLTLTCVVTLLAGFADAMVRVLMYSHLMGCVPAHYFGHVLSLMNAVSLIAQTVLAQGAGVLMDCVSPASGYVLIVAIGVLTLLLYRTHALDAR